MLIYYFNLFLILALAYPLCIRKPSAMKSAIYLLVTFGFMYFLSVARYGIGNDYKSYISIYEQVQATNSLGEVFALPWEKGYMLLLKLLAALHFDNTAMYAVMALLCLLPVAFFIYRYSPNIWLSTWLYVTLTFFYGTMNFVRQNIAAAILLLGYPLLRKRKLVPALCYVGVIVAAGLFHRTALLFMLPVLLVCYLPLNKWLGTAYGVAAVGAYFASEYILNFAMKYIFSQYKGSIYTGVSLGFQFLIIPALLFVLILCCKKYMAERFEDTPLLVNMMLYSFIIWLFITRHLVLERFSLYVYLYVLLSVPMATECLKPKAETLALRDRLQGEVKTLKSGVRDSKYKAAQTRYLKLHEEVRTQTTLYWCLIAGVLLATLFYNNFGMYDGTHGFHGVFPYQSLIPALNLLP